LHPFFLIEIAGVAEVLGVEVGEIVMMNLFYELVAQCTSIVAETPDGKIYHARNLDFGVGLAFTDGLRNLTLEVLIFSVVFWPN